MKGIERIKLKQWRTTRVKLDPGDYPDEEGQVIAATVPFYVDQVEEYDFEYPSLQRGTLAWRHKHYIWSSVRLIDDDSASVAPPPEPEPDPDPIAWWRRLFGLGPKIPRARVVNS